MGIIYCFGVLQQGDVLEDLKVSICDAGSTSRGRDLKRDVLA